MLLFLVSTPFNIHAFVPYDSRMLYLFIMHNVEGFVFGCFILSFFLVCCFWFCSNKQLHWLSCTQCFCFILEDGRFSPCCLYHIHIHYCLCYACVSYMGYVATILTLALFAYVFYKSQMLYKYKYIFLYIYIYITIDICMKTIATLRNNLAHFFKAFHCIRAQWQL